MIIPSLDRIEESMPENGTNPPNQKRLVNGSDT
jgi:hypothetical protein